MDTVLSSSGPFTVLARHAVVQWPDHSRLQLHHVVLKGTDTPCRYHWAVLHQQRPARLGVPALHRWLVVDTRTLCRAIADDMRLAPLRDRTGIVTLNLRLRYASAALCVAAVVSQAKASWRDERDGGAPLAVAA